MGDMTMLFPHWLVSLIEAYIEWESCPSTAAKKFGLEETEAAEFFADISRIFEKHKNIKLRLHNEIIAIPLLAIPQITDNANDRYSIIDSFSCPAVDNIIENLSHAMSCDDNFRKNILKVIIKT